MCLAIINLIQNILYTYIMQLHINNDNNDVKSPLHFLPSHLQLL